MSHPKMMKSIKVTVGDDPELNEQLQRYAMALGYSWEVGFDKPVYTNSHQLFFSKHGFIYRGVSDARFADKFVTMDAEDFFNLTRSDVDYHLMAARRQQVEANP